MNSPDASSPLQERGKKLEIGERKEKKIHETEMEVVILIMVAWY